MANEAGQVRLLASDRSDEDGAFALLSYLLVLTPLIYAMDGDPYRAWEVGFVGIIVVWAAGSLPAHLRWTVEATTLAAYAAVLVFQQFFIPDGSVWFGAKYAVSMATVFMPYWVALSLDWRLSDFALTWDRAIRVLAAIAILNFDASYALGIGEIHPGSLLGPRAFGYLGDSFTPVLIFPFLYFLFQRNYGWSAAVLSALVVTQGKAAAIMLLFGLGMYVFFRLRGPTRILFIVALSVLILATGLSAIRAAANSQVIDYSLVTRLVSYERGLRLSEEYPIWGAGINRSMNGAMQSALAVAKLANVTAFDANQAKTDNAFLRAMAETGIFGLAVLLALCFILIRRALVSIRLVWHAPPSRVRALVLASGIWVVSFILTYQFVGWFEPGHPQMTWLLLISSAGYVASQTYAKVAMAAPTRHAAEERP